MRHACGGAQQRLLRDLLEITLTPGHPATALSVVVGPEHHAVSRVLSRWTVGVIRRQDADRRRSPRWCARSPNERPVLRDSPPTRCSPACCSGRPMDRACIPESDRLRRLFETPTQAGRWPRRAVARGDSSTDARQRCRRAAPVLRVYRLCPRWLPCWTSSWKACRVGTSVVPNWITELRERIAASGANGVTLRQPGGWG